MKSRLFRLGAAAALVVAGLIAILLTSVDSATQEPVAIDWHADLDFLVETLVEEHPMPFARVSEQSFRQEVARLRNRLSRLDDVEAAVGLMRIAALLDDGHTSLWPGSLESLQSWYPIRLYRFADGVHITAIDEHRGDLVGSRVLRIAGRDAEAVLDSLSSVRGVENEYGRRETAYLASNAALLRGLGLVPREQALELAIVTPDGKRIEVVLQPVDAPGSFDWRGWGEMFGPNYEGAPTYRTAFAGSAPVDFLSPDESRPPHLRYRGGYSIWHIPAADAVYFQFNHVSGRSAGRSSEEWFSNLFEMIDSTDAGRLVIDLRYNGGGDGSILGPLYKGLIRRERFEEPGSLFILTGRKTFSAALFVPGELAKHLRPILVGEPSSAHVNHFGNAESYSLPSSGMQLSVSKVYHQYTDWSETPGRHPRMHAVDFPVEMAASDYMSGMDPALELVLGGTDLRPIAVIASAEGLQAARRAFDERMERYGHIPWWSPLDERVTNHQGYTLLEAGRTENAITVFELNTEAFPDSWNVWDSLGEAYLTAGRTEDGVRAYRTSLKLNPGNEHARMILRMQGGS